MREVSSLGTILKAMLLAGLLAGLALGIFHTFLTEPVIDQAIAIEEAREAYQDEAPPVVSRQTQKAGLVVGSLLYGLFVGTIFGGVYQLAQTVLPARRALARAGLVALAAFWLVGLLPFLKYPANPPGVGQPETIEYRQGLFLGFLLLSLVGGLVAAVAARRAVPRWLVLTGYAAYALALFVLMPSNPDPVEMPADLVLSFRVFSLAGLALFWLVLGLSFGWLAERFGARGRSLSPAAG